MTKVLERAINGGEQLVHRFDNGYGASVVRHSFSYGQEEDLWELAVVKFYGEKPTDWEIDYDTVITDDVVGHLTDSDVEELLVWIESLEKSE